MKKRAAKACLICIEVLAIIVAIGAAGGAYLYWRLEQGPAQLNFLKPSVEAAVERRFPRRYDATIEAVEVSREGRGAYAVRIVDVAVLDDERRLVAAADEVTAHFNSSAFFTGLFGPEDFEAIGAQFRIVRNEEQRIQIPAARRRETRSPLSALSPVFEDGFLNSAFKSAKMSDANITFHDEASGRSWRSENASVSLARTNSGLSATIAGDVDLGGEFAGLQGSAHYTEQNDVIAVELDGENFPIGDILTTFYGDRAAIIEAPVSGKAVISLTSGGEVLSSQFSASIDQGFMNIGGARAAVNYIRWDAAFNPEENQFEIAELAFDAGGSKGVIAGDVGVDFAGDARAPESVSFALSGNDLVAAAPGLLPDPVSISNARITGDYHLPDRRISLQSIDLSLLDIVITSSTAMAFPRAAEGAPHPSPEVKVNLTVDGELDPQRLLRIWPFGIAMGARDWIEARMEGAVISNINAVMDLPAGAVGEDGLIPDEAMNVTFDVSNAKAFYVQQMTPLTDASGSGVLRGNSFTLTVDRAQVGDISLSAGEVEFPVFIPKWQPTYIRFTADGKSEDILGLLDQEPLRLLSKISLQPDQFTGDASARVEIMRPNKRDASPDEYRYNGKATFQNMEMTGLFGDIVLTDAKGEVDLKPRSVTVNADAELSEAPIEFNWRQNFFDEDGPSEFKVSGTIDSSTGDLFGVASRQYLRGPVAFNVDAQGELGAFEKVDLDADFTDAALAIDALGWRKARGAPANGSVRFDMSSEGMEVSNLSLEGEGLSIAGNLAFDVEGALKQAHLPRVYLQDAADLAVTARREPSGELALNTVGEFLNAAPMLEVVIDGPPGDSGNAEDAGFDWGPGLSLTARIDRIRMRRDVEYRVAALDLRRDAENLKALDFTAFDHDGPPLTVNMSLTGEDNGPRRTITAQSKAIGALLRGVFGLTSVEGGEGSMLVNLSNPGEEGLAGEIEARNLRVVEAPLLARIFSAGSLDGLGNLLNGEGINLTYAYGRFDYSNGVLSVDDMRATGPSVGITADGAAAMGEGGDISLTGAVAPVYQVNSILGNAPIIGDILVGRKGEGILALSYSVTGERATPTVTVNPLSALTPGIFRRLFETQRVTPEMLSGEEQPAQETEAPTE